MKFDAKLLISHKLFLFYFLYLQNLIAKCSDLNVGDIYRKLDKLILRL
jgi:hypothetical protein